MSEFIEQCRPIIAKPQIQAKPRPSLEFTKQNGLWPWQDETRPRWQRYALYMRTPHWNLKRMQCFTRAGRQCENCYSRARLTVHHVNYDSLFAENLDDLACLCWPCHKKAEGGPKTRFELLKALRLIRPAKFEKLPGRPAGRIEQKIVDEIAEAESVGIANAFYGKSLPWFKS